MPKSVNAVESEYVIATHKLTRYLELMLNSAESYRTKLEEITTGGSIQDELITAQLIKLGANVKSIVSNLSDLDTSLSGTLDKYLTQIESADTFDYPDGVLSEILALLSVFL